MNHQPITELPAHRLSTKKANPARRLDESATTSLLLAAIAKQSSCTIARIDQLDHTPLTAKIVKGDDQSLLIQGRDSQHSELQDLTNGVLRIVLNVAGMDYTFDVPNGSTWLSAEQLLRIPTPRNLTLIERRRSPRRSFREAGQVRLCFTNENHRKICPTVLLNLSADGLACRAKKDDTTQLTIGQNVEADLQIGSVDQSLRLLGRIVSLTVGGSPETLVVGLEFLDGRNPPHVKSQLRTLLGTTK
ncbi:MAG: PilZ domain-containing protein [Planctomycetota bacterium]